MKSQAKFDKKADYVLKKPQKKVTKMKKKYIFL
jgi:hypothetical protein